MAKEYSKFEDFPKGQFLKASSWAQGAQDALREQLEGCGQMNPMACPIPHPCGVGGVEQRGACPGQALQSLGSRALINWVFYTIPCQGRVEVGGRGQEVQKGLGEETSSMSHCS